MDCCNFLLKLIMSKLYPHNVLFNLSYVLFSGLYI